jgi:serine/threonine protein kinase
MTREDGLNVPESVRSAIQSQHPRIGDEIQGAINTLRKLQWIAGEPAAAAADPAGTDDGEASIEATSEGVGATPPADAARPAPLLAARDTFGRYQIVRLLGRGAMGAVYLAYDSQLQRHVALKTPILGGNALVVDRFLREARAAAQLRSPNICPVYDVGQIGGIYYLSMAFIEGQLLSRAIAEGRLADGRAIAGVIQKIARGLQKAHELGMIHRDLKPDNIMLDADGEPVVMDFGLARRVDEDAGLTAPGRILGTPAYMSPEQVDGDPKKIGPATDVYSLGVVLYVMLTGRLPFQGSITAVLRQIACEQPSRPSLVNPALGEASPLDGVCLKMMAKSHWDRYASMTEVIDALEEAFPRERPPAVHPLLWRRLVAWSGRLFTSRPGPSAAVVAAEGSRDRTLVDPKRGKPADKKDSNGEQTIDQPASSGAGT